MLILRVTRCGAAEIHDVILELNCRQLCMFLRDFYLNRDHDSSFIRSRESDRINRRDLSIKYDAARVIRFLVVSGIFLVFVWFVFEGVDSGQRVRALRRVVGLHRQFLARISRLRRVNLIRLCRITRYLRVNDFRAVRNASEGVRIGRLNLRRLARIRCFLVRLFINVAVKVLRNGLLIKRRRRIVSRGLYDLFRNIFQICKAVDEGFGGRFLMIDLLLCTVVLGDMLCVSG